MLVPMRNHELINTSDIRRVYIDSWIGNPAEVVNGKVERPDTTFYEVVIIWKDGSVNKPYITKNEQEANDYLLDIYKGDNNANRTN